MAVWDTLGPQEVSQTLAFSPSFLPSITNHQQGQNISSHVFILLDLPSAIRLSLFVVWNHLAKLSTKQNTRAALNKDMLTSVCDKRTHAVCVRLLLGLVII